MRLNEINFCSTVLHSVSSLCYYVLVNKLLTGLWESKQGRLIRAFFRQQWGEYEKYEKSGENEEIYLETAALCVVASDDRDKCLARKTLKKTRFEAN